MSARALGYPALLVVAFACSRTEPRSSPPRPVVTAPSVVASTARPTDEVRHRCAADVECLVSCGHGAVNAAWYMAAHPGGERCEDGCASKGMRARCDVDRCVAERAGTRVPECTGLFKPVAPIGPYHACASDADCRSTCKYGAVNAHVGGLVDDCKDGCATGGLSTRCDRGACVTIGDSAVVPACTRVSIWR